MSSRKNQNQKSKQDRPRRNWQGVVFAVFCVLMAVAMIVTSIWR
jgi:hypothetical protein